MASAPADIRVLVCPDPASAPSFDHLGGDRVQVLLGDNAYAAIGDTPASLDAQVGTFEALVDDALDDGYRALFVVADNTSSLLGTTADLRRWLAWEQRTDRWQAERPIAGLCWFDVDRVPADALEAVAHRHPRSGGGLPQPAWMVFHEAYGAAVVPAIAGAVDEWDVDAFAAAVRTELSRPTAPSVIDVGGVTYLHHRAIRALGDAARSGYGEPVRLLDAPHIVARLCEYLGLDSVVVG